MAQFFHIFPDVHVDNDPYPIQFGSGDWITVISRTALQAQQVGLA